MRHNLPWTRWSNDERGTVAIIFSFMSLIAFGLIGSAIDMGRIYNARTMLQNQADALALAAVSQGNQTTSDQESALAAAAEAKALEAGLENVQSSVERVSDTDVTVSLSGEMRTAILGIIPGMDRIPMDVSVTARGYTLKLVAGPPSKVDLSYEAGDYNQVWAYCYDRNWGVNGTRASDEGTKDRSEFDDLFTPLSADEKAGLTNTQIAAAETQRTLARDHKWALNWTMTVATQENRFGRSDFRLIAHNGPGVFRHKLPTCLEHETISYMMWNTRNSRTNPGNWGSNHWRCRTHLDSRAPGQGGKSTACWSWYTDTTFWNGVEQHHVSPYQLETVLCEDKHCNVRTEAGAFIPGNNQRHRVPQKHTKVCAKGKFMYFGWEDRPPQNQGGNGYGLPHPAGVSDPGGDRDYDDIRLTVSCPEYVADKVQVRLID